MGYQDLETSTEIGEAIQKTIKNKNLLILASSDLTHQEPQESANKKDRIVIKAIQSMDENKLQAEVRENRITTCGYGPISAAIVASRKLGADSATLLQYYTSGDIINDFRSVVGYAAIKIS
jgi:hypothetical protein